MPLSIRLPRDNLEIDRTFYEFTGAINQGGMLCEHEKKSRAVRRVIDTYITRMIHTLYDNLF